MTTVTLQLPDEIFKSLQQLAEKHELSLQELIQANIEQMLASPEPTFDNALDHVLNKNEKLYKRLA